MNLSQSAARRRHAASDWVRIANSSSISSSSSSNSDVSRRRHPYLATGSGHRLWQLHICAAAAAVAVAGRKLLEIAQYRRPNRCTAFGGRLISILISDRTDSCWHRSAAAAAANRRAPSIVPWYLYSLHGCRRLCSSLYRDGHVLSFRRRCYHCAIPGQRTVATHKAVHIFPVRNIGPRVASGTGEYVHLVFWPKRGDRSKVAGFLLLFI